MEYPFEDRWKEREKERNITTVEISAASSLCSSAAQERGVTLLTSREDRHLPRKQLAINPIRKSLT